ncbi:MAG: nucleotidyltransferase domain-containing protein [Bacillota bacterium]
MGVLQGFQEILGELLDCLRAVYGYRLMSVVVFGSVGRGRPRHDSDIDVLIVATGLPRGRLARMEEFGKVEDMLATTLSEFAQHGICTYISPVIKTPEEKLTRGACSSWT